MTGLWKLSCPLFLLLFLPFTCIAMLRVGHLVSDSEEEEKVLALCVDNRTINLITLPACDQFNGVENAAQLHYKYTADVFTGAYCDEESQTISRLAFRWNKLYISPSLHSTTEREKTTISIQYNSHVGYAAGILALLRDMGWRQIGIIHSSQFSELATVIRHEVVKKTTVNVTVSVKLGEYHWQERIRSNTRVIIALCSINEFGEFLLNHLETVDRPQEFIMIFIETERLLVRRLYEHLSKAIIQSDPSNYLSKLKFLKNIFFFQSIHPNTVKMKKWASSRNLKLTTEMERHLMLCDAMNMLASIDKGTKKTSVIWNDLVTHLSHGFSGPLFITPQGERQLFFHIYAYLDGKPVIAGRIEPSNDNCTTSDCVWHSLLPTPFTNETLMEAPPNFPICGFDGEFCSKKHLFLIAGLPLVLLVILFLIFGYYQIKERELRRMPWRVAHERLNFTLERDHPGYRRVSTASSSKGSTADDDDKHAYVGNSKVFVHRFEQKRAINFSRDEMIRLNQLKYLTHTNVNVFHGISFNQNSELLVLWTYCVRRSLEDVLFAGGQRLGRNFQSTFIKHILNGLQYIHQSSFKAHGALFLSNCVVDSYWVVKLTDFGLNEIIRHKMEHKELKPTHLQEMESISRDYLQWPPEYLEVLAKTKNRYSIQETATGDMYQIGMVIYQILFYRRPFREKAQPLEELIDSICDSTLANPMRPFVPEPADYTMRMISIIHQCWQHRPETRPALFKVTDAVAREFGKDAKGTLIDQMIQMIDEYSANLEEIVAERTQELENLQQKTENLLYQVLPKSIADALRDGQKVKPELHSSVSILVVDICEFTKMCESSIPEHIIEILNQLYTSFDNIVQQHNVLKLENVGDAYLLVGGIPATPKHEHLEDVCKLSLQMRKFMLTFVPTRQPDHKLHCKFGISSGAVASGVLGNTAPRFCLFGDSVNMACKMASSGEAEKIQITEHSYNICIEEFPHMVLEERGVITIKGKGPCTTYWLWDEPTKGTPLIPNTV